jgi:tetratricopeptide (TPR) repeat protein
VIILSCLAVPSPLDAEDAAEYITRAQAWLDKGEYGKAIDDCDRALAVDSQSAEAYNVRGRARIFTGDYQKALDDCNEALAINPKFAEAYNTRGSAWRCKFDYDKAIADCNRALTIDPKLAQAYSNRGESLFQKGEIDKALADCDKALTLNPKLADAYFVRAWVWDRKGNQDRAGADWRQALAITPDDWKTLNNYGIVLWKQAQVQDAKAANAEAAGDLGAAKEFRQKSVALKDEAKVQWTHGVTVRPTATDIHSNLGYAYSEANDLDKAEWHLTRAIALKPISPRPHNNLGRVLLRQSQQLEAKAREAEAKGKTNPAEAAKAKPLKDEAKTKLDAAIEQFEKTIELDPTLLEARLNLGEVYIMLNQLDKAEAEYRAILKLQTEDLKDPETISYFSITRFGLARIALSRKNVDEAISELQKAIELNPKNVAALQFLATQQFLQGEYPDGEKHLWRMLAILQKPQRRNIAERFGNQFDAAGKTKEAVRTWNFLGWALATNPDPKMLDPETAMVFAKRAAEMTKEKDPLSLDTLAAAQAAGGHYKEAVQLAQDAIKLANSQGTKPLADAVSRRLQLYQQEKPYRCDPNDNDRP